VRGRAESFHSTLEGSSGPEAWVDRHDQQKVEIADRFLGVRERRAGLSASPPSSLLFHRVELRCT